MKLRLDTRLEWFGLPALSRTPAGGGGLPGFAATAEQTGLLNLAFPWTPSRQVRTTVPPAAFRAHQSSACCGSRSRSVFTMNHENAVRAEKASKNLCCGDKRHALVPLGRVDGVARFPLSLAVERS